jgi:uncharacterized protein (TIGR02271 family)
MATGSRQSRSPPGAKPCCDACRDLDQLPVEKRARKMQGASVIRDDGTRGKVVAVEKGQLVVEFGDGSRLVLPPERLALQKDGTYRFPAAAAEFGGAAAALEEEVVIPVVAEELTVETVQIVRGKVRANKRVETREEMVDAPVTREEVIVEHIPVNKLVDDVAPEVRDENGVLVIPLIEEVLVVEKRLLVREEVRISKRRTTTSTPQRISLRREVVDIEREEFDGVEVPKNQPLR